VSTAAVPRPPSGAIARPPLRGELARWHHADRLPFIETAIFAGTEERPPSVTVATGPARAPLEGVTDPAELRRGAWLLLGAARALEHERRRLDLPEHAQAEPDPQITIFDYPEATPR
jgi:hypothetical protein